MALPTPTDHPPQAAQSDPTSGGNKTTMSGNTNNSNNNKPSKYHALIIDSGAIIKQTSLASSTHSLLNSAQHYYTVPAVLSEIRDPKSRKHLEEFKLRLLSLHDTSLITRTPSREAVSSISEFARKTGDYSQLSGVDLQVLALLYDLEVEAAGLYNGGNLDYVRTEPKRVLGVSVKALNGDGKRSVVRKERSGSVASSVAGSSVATNAAGGSMAGNTAFFRGNADGIIDASTVDLEYDDDEDDRMIADPMYETTGVDVEREDSSPAAVPPKTKSWAVLVNPTKASTVPAVDYSIATGATLKKEEEKEDEHVEEPSLDAKEESPAAAVDGQFDDASSSENDDDGDDFSNGSDSDGELDAINIANGANDDEMSDEECDVFVLEPHEAAYYKKLKEEKAQKELVQQMERQAISSKEEAGASSTTVEEEGTDFPSLAASAAVPYEGSDVDETEESGENKADDDAAWRQEEDDRKKKALQPMVNGRIVHSNNNKKSYNSFRKYKNVVSADGAAVAMKQQKEHEKDETTSPPPAAESPLDAAEKEVSNDTTNAYKSRILGSAGASSATDFPSEMTAADDDGEGWVTSTNDIRTMKATGSLHLSSNSNSNHHRNGNKKSYAPRKDAGPPISQRAACATTDFAMQNVILQMNLELLSVDGVRVRRLKTWVTRCGACYTIYGNDERKKTERLFCDKCGSDALQRIAASVDRNTGRLKLHMKKNYQYNTRGTKFSMPKAGKGNKYEGDLLLAEDQLLYGAWNQKLRKGKSKSSSQSIFGSDLASDLGCHTDLTKRDDIRVGFGRRNPNAAKFGRERRGKTKKGTKDKACGLRRY